MRVFNLSDYKRLKGIKKDSAETDIRVERVKKSIDRINQLMANLRENKS